MGKKGRKGRKRQYKLVPEAGTRHVIEMAKSMHQGAAARDEFQKRLDSAPAGFQARKKADNTAELRLTNLPYLLSVDVLAKAIDHALEDLMQELKGEEAEGVQYVQRCSLINNRRIALVQVTPASVAKEVVARKKLSVADHEVMVVSFKSLGFGAQRHTRQEPGSFDFRFLRVEFGEMEDRSFKVLWASRDEDEEDGGGHVVQVQMVSKVIGFCLKGIYDVRRGDAKSGTFGVIRSGIRLEIPYQSIIEAASYQKISREERAHAVYFPLRHPPFIFRAVKTLGNTVWSREAGVHEETNYVRTIDFTENKAFSRTRAARIFLDTRDGSFADFARKLCQAHIGKIYPPKMPLSVAGSVDSSISRATSKAMVTACKYSVPFVVRYEVECLFSIGAISENVLEQNSFWERIGNLSNVVEMLKVVDRLFVAASSISDYRIDASQALDDAIRSVTSAEDLSDIDSSEGSTSALTGTIATDRSSGVPSTTEYALSASVSVVPTNTKHLIDPGVTAATAAIIRDADEVLIPDEDNNANFLPIRRCLITPTKIVPCKAEMDMLNRVLREFHDHRERFIRVTFADEDGESISYLDSHDLYAQVREHLRDGITVAGEQFVFLAFSSSQLREHGFWFYNEFHSGSPGSKIPPSAEQIRRWFGDLSNIHVPSRYAARMGQAFSSTVGTLILTNAQFKVVDDVTAPDPKNPGKEYVFSDGVGLMDSTMANQVKNKLRLSSRRSPSAYQVRFAGAKGMLSVWDNVVGGGIVFRKSQVKYESRHRALEIVGYSKRLPFFLNRQFVTLLEGLGVPGSVFVTIQKQYLEKLDVIMEPGETQASLDLLYTTGWGSDARHENDRLLRSVGPMANAVTLLRAGLTCRNCEFLFEVMTAFRRKVLRGVKNRARIPIMDACNLVGVMDDSAAGVLKENQIFVRYTHPETRNLTPLVGKCIVGRTPALHPGDLQIVEAVDHPELRHLIDVVVFPKVGKRPLPNKLSGGDLDGDTFSVIWDDRLICAKADQKPMDYTAEEESPLDRPVTVEDVKDFVIKFMQNDNLGRIATRHLVTSDKEGIFSENAKLLAHLHSTAVDFAKTGIPANFPQKLMLYNSAGSFPDFLGKAKSISYKSGNALGVMYRLCLGRGLDRDASHFDQRGTAAVDRVFDLFKYEEDLDIVAVALCKSWNSQVQALMDMFGVETEAEMVTGQVTRFSNQNALAKSSKKYRSQLNVLGRYMRDLKNAFRDQFFSDVGMDDGKNGGGGRSKLTVAACQKQAAWYKAAKQVANEDRKNNRIPILSFPFVVTEVFEQIVAAHLNDDGSSDTGDCPSPPRADPQRKLDVSASSLGSVASSSVRGKDRTVLSRCGNTTSPSDPSGSSLSISSSANIVATSVNHESPRNSSAAQAERNGLCIEAGSNYSERSVSGMRRGNTSLDECVVVKLMKNKGAAHMGTLLMKGQCPYEECSKKFKTRTALKQHLDSVRSHPVWICCGRPFLSYTSYNQHRGALKVHKEY